MSEFATLPARSKGEALCSRFKAVGLKPVWMEVTDDQIVIGFEFISAHPTWTKAFRFNSVHATADAFIGLMNEWKNKIRRDIVQSTASTIVQNMIREHGLMAVLDAMEDTPRDRSH
jgi:hypothetical protein